MSATNDDPVSAIPRQTMSMQSHPINPEAPSLLTTIPGEVRNAIFEALFELGDPIQISRDRYAYGYPSTCYQSRDVRGIALLRTCRQIHEEATGVLYSRNIFCVSLPDDRYTAEPIPWAMAWLDDIGRQSSSVRHLQIYIHNVFHGLGDVIDISPILHQAWEPDRAALKVELLPRWYPEWNPPGDDLNRIAKINAVSCNRQMATIIDDPSGMIKKFCSVPSLLREVCLSFLDHHVHLHYYESTYSGDRPLAMDIIDIVDNGAESSFSKRRPVTDIKRIMSSREIRNSILTMALCPDEDITFDLTNRTTNVDVAYIASVTTCLTGTHERGFREGAFGVTLTSMTTPAAFTAELKILRGLPLGGPANITIRYYLDNNASLDDVRLDALALLNATGCHDPSKPVRIEVYSKSGTAPIKGYTVSLENIRQSILLFMYQIFKKTPEHMLAQVPRIWMSGRGEAWEAEWDLTKCSIEPIVNNNVEISLTVIQSRYEEIEGMLENMLSRSLPPDCFGDFGTRLWH